MKFKQIKSILLKAGIGIFWEELKKNNIDYSFNYYVNQKNLIIIEEKSLKQDLN